MWGTLDFFVGSVFITFVVCYIIYLGDEVWLNILLGVIKAPPYK